MSNELAGAQVAPSAAPAAPQADAPAFPSPFADIVAGKVPGVVLDPIEGGQPTDVQEFAIAHFPELTEVLGYTDTEAGHSVFYNTKLLSEDKVHELDRAGKLTSALPVAKTLANPQNAPAATEQPAAGLAAASAAPAGALSSAKVTGNAGMRSARLANSKPVDPAIPTPVVNTLGKRPV